MTDTVNVPRAWLRDVFLVLSDWNTPLGEKLFSDTGSMLAAAPKAEPVKTDPQIAFENMRRHFPNDRRDWTDLTSEQRKEWEEDVSERPHLYDLRAKPEAPKVEQEPDTLALNAYRHLTNYADAADHPQRAGIRKVRDDVYAALQDHPAPASDELLEALKPFALNLTADCDDGEPLKSFFMVSSIRHAAKVYAKHKGPQS